MFTKLLLKLSPLTKYLTIAGLVGAFLFGIYVSHLYYNDKINDINLSFNKAQLAYVNRIIEADNEYVDKMTKYRHVMETRLQELHNELSKPDYQCPIPDDGIKLLNDAIKGTAAN